MKKGWKIFWIVMGSVAGLGIIFSCIALALGLSFSELEEAYPDGIGFIRRGAIIVQRDRDDWNMGTHRMADNTESYENISSLQVEVVGCDVAVLYSDDDQIHVSTEELRYGSTGVEIQTGEESGKLVIRSVKNGKLWTSLLPSRDYGMLYIYIPSHLTLEIAEFNLGGSDTHIESINAKELNINLDAGDCDIEDFQADTVNANIGAGDISISGNFEQDFTLKCGAGDAEIYLPGQKHDYNYSVKCGLGDLTIGNEEFSGIASVRNVDNGSSKNMEIMCGAGEVDVEFGN